jgi:hypothetical protein
MAARQPHQTSKIRQTSLQANPVVPKANHGPLSLFSARFTRALSMHAISLIFRLRDSLN